MRGNERRQGFPLPFFSFFFLVMRQLLRREGTNCAIRRGSGLPLESLCDVLLTSGIR